MMNVAEFQVLPARSSWRRLLLAALLLFTSPVSAQQGDEEAQKFIEVNVAASFDPISAIGLFLSEKGAMERPAEQIRRVDPNTVVVKVPYLDRELPRDTMVTAILFSADGNLGFGSVRPIFTQDARESYLSLPYCPPEKLNFKVVESQLSSLENVLQLRVERRGILQVRVAQIMSDKLVEKLNRLERGFGLARTAPLSPSLPPVELIDRLNRILESIKSVKTSAPAAKQEKPKAK